MFTNGFTNYLNMKILRGVFGNAPLDLPEVMYALVSTTPIAQDGTGYTEPTDTAYARVAVPRDTAWEDLLAGYGRQTAIDIEWNSALVPWGEVIYFALADSADTNTGNVLAVAKLTNPKPIGVEDILRIDASQLKISMVGTFSE